jgi:hypothetical protein
LAGVPPEVVAATGSWTSLAFLLYWLRVEEIIPLSTSNAYNRSQLSSLAVIFDQFRIHHKIPLSTSILSSFIFIFILPSIVFVCSIIALTVYPALFVL